MKRFILPAGFLCLVAGRLTAQGYDVARLQVTLQPQEPAAP